MDEGRPIFVQIAEQIEAQIMDGTLPEESRVPSTNELAVFHRINPATAAKGLGMLAADGVLYKQRGIGLFVAEGARDQIRERHRAQFCEQYVRPMLAEAERLGIDAAELRRIIENGSGS
jgi:DNA-binding transcriptional regulator YhcF (GntR family)